MTRSRNPRQGDAAQRPDEATAGAPPVLLSGGNPQIAKGDGDAPVQAYIAAMPGWKRDVGRRLDTLIMQTVPDARKAVRWNSPFYGIAGQGWFASVHVFTRYVKVTFLNGASLDPPPPEAGKDPDSRWVNIYEGQLGPNDLDGEGSAGEGSDGEGSDGEGRELEERMIEWVRQSAAIPGWKGF